MNTESNSPERASGAWWRRAAIVAGVGLQLAAGTAFAESAPLVAKVRAATQRYLDINVALGEGWVPATPCVSGPNTGAMGVHLVLPARIGDGAVDANAPEALIYQPMPSGAMRLVGVEFLVL